MTSKFGNFVVVSLLLMYPIFNKIGFNQNRGITHTYFKLKYSLRHGVSLRVENWSSVILTCSWSTPTKRYFYIRGLLIIIRHQNLSTLLLVLFGYYLLPVLLVPRGMSGLGSFWCCLLNHVYILIVTSIMPGGLPVRGMLKLRLYTPRGQTTPLMFHEGYICLVYIFLNQVWQMSFVCSPVYLNFEVVTKCQIMTS